MKISGFSYVRNGFDYGCPIIESIESVLPICDEFVIAVGDSNDGTREAISNIQSDKIKIIDTVWDMQMRQGGKIFAQQSNIALDHITGNWALHIQADEVIHEKSLPKIIDAVKANDENKKVEGFILPFLHFWGDYYHIRNSRRVHNYEIRLFRNEGVIRSYKDSQGFRKYNNLAEYETNEEKGKKLLVKKIDAPVFHYNGVRSKKLMAKKSNNFQAFYGNEEFVDQKAEKFGDDYDLNWVDRVAEFTDTHPLVMKDKIEQNTFRFEHDTSKAVWVKYDKWLQPIEDFLGFKMGEYKNYEIL